MLAYIKTSLYICTVKSKQQEVMKQSVASITIDELKKKYKSQLSKAEESLRDILTLNNNDRLVFHTGWPGDFYHHSLALDNEQKELLLLSKVEKSDSTFAYAIPVVYCISDGTTARNGNYSGKKVWTLFAIMTSDGQMRTEFVPNRFDWNENMHPDFKSIGFRNNFVEHTQYKSDRKFSEKFFDLYNYIEKKQESKRKEEEYRRGLPAKITVGELEDFMAEFKEMKDMLKTLMEKVK